MATLTVKNVPDDLYAALKDAAKAERRSVNSEVIVRLEESVRSRRRTVEVVLEHARRVREYTRDHPLTDELLAEMKAEGRP